MQAGGDLGQRFASLRGMIDPRAVQRRGPDQTAGGRYLPNALGPEAAKLRQVSQAAKAQHAVNMQPYLNKFGPMKKPPPLTGPQAAKY